MAWKADPNSWSPFPHQERWLRNPAFELCVGGAAGPGKSAYLLVEAARHVHRNGYRALLLRREATQIRKEILPSAQELYAKIGGVWRASDMCFLWKDTGARIFLGGLETDGDVRKWQGQSFQFLGFDELTHFTEHQYTYMFARARASSLCQDVVPRIRSATNPGSVGHDWVLKRFAPWLYPRPGELNHDPSYKGPWATPGQILWFVRDQNDSERVVPAGTPDAMCRSFLPARVQENPVYAGTTYESTLRSMSRLDREHLLGGNWMARPSAGMFFQRAWFAGKIVGAAPAQVVARIRYWDLAATPAERARPGGAWTSGLLLSKTADRRFWIEDIVRGQWSPGDVKRTVRATAKTDPKGTRVVIEHDPGQAGTAQAFDYVTDLAGYDVHAVKPQGDKVTRCKPASAQAEVGNIWLVESGDWISPFFREAESFPEGTCDQIDSLSGAFNQLQRFGGWGGRAAGKREIQREGSAF